MKQFLISSSGNDRIGKTDTFATVTENEAPKGSVTLAISTVYSKARDPNHHLVRNTIHFASKVELANYARFLLDAADAWHPIKPLDELLADEIQFKLK
jgi:hypothetical protein